MIHTSIGLDVVVDHMTRVLGSGNFTGGEQVQTFESLVSTLYDQHAVAFNSAGTALYSVLRCLGVKRVVAPNNTFYATGGMALEAGCEVTLADCSREDFSMDFGSLLKVYSGQDAVILTHVGGTVAGDYQRIAEWCNAKGILLIEDAAHAFGVLGKHPPGSLSRAAVFSFYPTKAVPVGEGGVVVTRDQNLARDLSVFRNYGKHLVNGAIQYTGKGFNFRMDEWTAAIACIQVRRVEEIMDLRRSDAHKLSQIVEPLVSSPHSNWYKFIAAGYFPAKRTTGRVYQLSDQLRSIPVFSKTQDFSVEVEGDDFRVRVSEFPNSDWVASNHICLPLGEGMYSGMSLGQVEAYLLGED